ncbi:MAG: DNA mismatch repair endonuclease MutL [Myxococcaceae bacterium]|nr:DNA mismatch repair endonuclease MutL [Myxococcaceae bacterium]
MGRITVLSEELINKIAAGEVVERPASVVKELGENALDAGARNVRFSLRGGGLTGITVVDDGHGMSRDDAQLALGRHATSKLKSLDDLFHIVSFGFRGEALPAIASVSRFSLCTAEPGAPVGTRLDIEGGGLAKVSDHAPTPGTRIDVEDLFFNTPARRKFLKREATELGHAEEAVIRLALAHPEVGFSLEHDGRTLISSPAGADPKERIAAALGAEVFAHLLPVEERRLGLKLRGFIASPEFTLPTARGLYAFVNGRYIRDRAVIAAVQRAYQEQLPAGRQPVAVLFLEIDPQAVDVNVHPQKLEVRFADTKGLQEVLVTGIRRALESAPWRVEGADGAPVQGPAHYAMAVERFLARAQTSTLPVSSPSPHGLALGMAQPQGFGLSQPTINEAAPEGFFAQLKWVGELGQRLWLCEGTGGTLVVIDPLAVRERLFVSTWTQALLKGEPALANGHLLPMTAPLEAKTLSRFVEAAEVFREIGLTVEPFGTDAVMVRGLPWQPTSENAEKLIADLLPALPARNAEASMVALAELLKIIAHHAADAQPRSVNAHEAHALLRALETCDFTIRSIRGHVVVHQMPLLELLRHSGT